MTTTKDTKFPVQRVVKTEPLEYSSSDLADSSARGRKRAVASAPGGSRKAKMPRRESPVRRSKPHRASGRPKPGSSGKQRIGSSDVSSGAPRKKVKSADHRRHGHKGGDRGRHDAGQSGTVVASRTRSWNGEGRKVASAAKYSAHVGSDDSEDDDYHYSPDESNGSPAKVKSAGRRRRGHKGGGSDWRGSAPARQVGAGVSSRTRSRNGDRGKGGPAAKHTAPLVSNHGEDDDEMEEVSSDDNRRSRDNEEEDVVKGKNKVDDNDVSSDDNGRSRDNEEGGVVKGKNKVGDNGDSEEMYKSAEEEETGENVNGIHEESYAGVDEEDSDDTAEPEDEELGEEDDESNEAGEEVPGTPIGKKIFEGLCLIDKPDNTFAGEGISKRTRLQRRCSDKKLLTQGTFSKPYCLDSSETEPEEEEEVPPPAQTEQAQPSDEDDSGGDDGVPTKKRRRPQHFCDSDDSDSDSEDSSDDSEPESESDRTYARNARKGPSSSKPTNGGALYRQQHTAKEGCKDDAGCSNPRRVKSYAANAGNPADRGNLQQGDVSFKKNALLPHKRKRGGNSRQKTAYDDLFNSIFYEVEKSSAPAQAKQGWDDRYPLVFSFGDEEEVPVEKTEHDLFMEDLWAHRDFVEETINADKGEGSNAQEIPAKKERPCIEGMEHDFYLDDQIGIMCRHCKFIHTEIRHVYPDVMEWSDSEERELREERDLDRALARYLKECDADDMLNSIGREGERISINSSYKSGPVWDLVPGAWESMFSHQREAFQFMWTKLAGGTSIEQVKKVIKRDTSGCVVSHAPGTGKTRLAITFVQSYLELFPRCSPLILAPKGMLATWGDEFRKWNSKVPFHVLSSRDIHWDVDKTIQRLAANDDDIKRKLLDKALDKKFRRNLKLLSWSEGNSVIGISYTQFRNLAKEGGSNDDDDARKIRKLLLQRPDLLVLDEGHIPRTRNSRIYKALDQVRTRNRIILSGTPFQNNFEELHSTLCLLRAGDVDPSFWNSLTLNNVTDERLNEIRTKLDPFVHIHKGDVLNKALPGLRESVVILNPLPMQKRIIEMMEKSETKNVSGLSKKKSVFGFEHRISLASVHPSLITSMSNLPEEVASIVDKPSLEKIRLKPSEGVKARFVYEIVRRCIISKERVIVFSQFLETLVLIMEQLISLFNWTRDKEVLLMTGEVRVETRQQLIMAFNDMNSDAKVMLASTKACGEGIQLIGASRVVLLDVVWNPSVGKQAIGRAYRIGQQKIVHTYNLIAEGTQEKSKYDRQAKKDHMSKMLFSNESQPAQCNQSPESIFHDSILEDMTEDENLKEMFVNILPSQ